MKVEYEVEDIWAGRRLALYLGKPEQIDFIIGYRHDTKRNVYGLIDTRDGMFTDIDFSKSAVAEYLNQSANHFLPSETLTRK